MDELWPVLIPVAGVAGFFLRAALGAIREAIRDIWGECKARRRFHEQLLLLRERNTHVQEMRELDIESTWVKESLKSGYRTDSGGLGRGTSSRPPTSRAGANR